MAIFREKLAPENIDNISENDESFVKTYGQLEVGQKRMENRKPNTNPKRVR
jgi:hypothetical protein